MTPWSHQLHSVSEVLAAIDCGERMICLTIPTGGGKTWVAQQLARKFLESGKKVSLYSNRRLMIEQLSRGLMEAGMYHGIRAAGHEDERDHPFQVSSFQTEHSRSIKRKTWELHQAALVLIDEGHLHTGTTAQVIRKQHLDSGAVIVDFTATPLGMRGVCDRLIVGATVSELRECGALVPAIHYGPDEPDFRQFKKLRAALEAGENPSERELEKAYPRTPQLFGRIWNSFEHLNPAHRPTLLFAPDVAGSLWFAEQFSAKGVTAAHVDGECVWLDGKLYRTDSYIRAEVLRRSEDGRCVVVCNRYVLREGVDCPWLCHGIFATVFGSIGSYLQAGGRLLRSHPSLDSVIIQDHGGNWWRHGSLNEDREWHLDYTGSIMFGLRADRLRKPNSRQPFCCPRCRRVWVAGAVCSPARGGCGFELDPRKRSRAVVSTDGTLKEMSGDPFQPRRICGRPGAEKLWEQMYWRSRSKKGARTFRAAKALFAYENNWQWPDPSWPLMPTEPMDEFRLVAEVPMERLTGEANGRESKENSETSAFAGHGTSVDSGPGQSD